MIRNSLRIIILFLLIVLIINPSYSVSEKEKNNKTAFFIDVSASMGNKSEDISKILKDKKGKIFYFAGDVSENKENIKYSDLTDIYGVCNRVSSKFNNAVIISDGFHNSGTEVLNTPAKIFTLGLSNNTVSKDIILFNCDYKKEFFVNEKQTFLFDIFLKGTEEIDCFIEFAGENREINLKKGNNRINFEKQFDKGEYSKKALIIPENWENDKNNNSLDIDFTVKNKEINILLKNKHLNPDISFLKSRLKKLGSIKHLFKEHISSDLKKFQVFCEFDDLSLNRDDVLSFIENGGLYLGFITEKTENINNIFFSKKNLLKNIKTEIDIPANYLRMPYYNIFEDSEKNKNIWKRNFKLDFLAQLEPLRQSQEILKTSSNNAVIRVFPYGKGIAVVFHGGPFYKMALSQINEHDSLGKDMYYLFFKNLISYYGSFNDMLEIKGLKNYYSKGQKVNLVFDNSDKNSKYEFYLNGKRLDVRNKITFDAKKEGKNIIEVKLYRGNENLKNLKRTFFVINGLDELASFGINKELLNDISISTGGKYFSFEDLNSLLELLDENSIILRKIYIRHSLFFILFFLIIFSLYLYFDFIKK